MANGSPVGRTEPEQFELFCLPCARTGTVVAELPDAHGDVTRVPVPCPVCRPRPSVRETWPAVATLGRRLVWEEAAAGR
jgi:hypothetical protein